MFWPCSGHWGRHWGCYSDPIRVAIGVAIVWAFIPPFCRSIRSCSRLLGFKGVLFLSDFLQSFVLQRMAIG